MRLDLSLQIYGYGNMKQVQIATVLIPKVGRVAESMVFRKRELPHAFQWTAWSHNCRKPFE